MVPQATLVRSALLQPENTPTQGVKVIVGGDGTRFFLIKDVDHHWGLWQGTSVGIEEVYVPLPGLKHSDIGAVIPWDGTMVIYLLSRYVFGTQTYHPLHHIELTAPQFKAPVWRSDLDPLRAQDLALRQQDTAFTVQNTALKQQIAALEARIKVLEAKTTQPHDEALAVQLATLAQRISNAGTALKGE